MPECRMTRTLMQGIANAFKQFSEYSEDLLAKADEHLHRAPITSADCLASAEYLQRCGLGFERQKRYSAGLGLESLLSS